jgi:HK97 family phage prohead protease
MGSPKLVTQRKAGPTFGFKALDEGPAPEPPGTFEAFVSVFDNVDLDNERVRPGAFAGTLARWRESGDPIPVIFSHQWGDLDAHVGVVVDASEVPAGDPRLPAEIAGLGGLYVKGALDIGEDFAGRLWKRLKRRSIREFSFAYDVLKAQPANDGVLDLVELDLIEVGPTLKGANPLTELVGAKHRSASDALDVLELADRLRDELKSEAFVFVEPPTPPAADPPPAATVSTPAPASAGTVRDDGKVEPELNDGKTEAKTTGEAERAALEAELESLDLERGNP